MLGLGFYGRGFKLIDPKNSTAGSPSRGGNKAGSITSEDGMLSYFEVFEFENE